MTRVTLLTPDFPPAVGGVQRYLGEAAQALAGRHDVTVVTAAHREAAAHDAGRAYRVLRTRTAWGGARSAAVLAEMMRMGRRCAGDITVAGHLAVLPAALAAARRPVACCFYGSELWSPKMRPLLRRLAPGVHRAICISHFTAGEVERCGIAAERIRYVWPGADRVRAPESLQAALVPHGLWNARTGRPSPYLLSVGRLVEPHKGVDQLLRVLPALRRAVPDMRLVIVGDGPLRARYEGIARTGLAADSVLWAGRVGETEKHALLSGARALVMLSRESRSAAQFEGFGIALVEAAFAGRPSIAGASGGIPDAVVHGTTGLLVDPADSVAVLEAARRLLEDADLADHLGAQALQRAEREFTWERSMARMVDVVAELT